MRQQRKATVFLFLASFLWGSSFVGSKVCLNAGMLPFEIVFYRMVIGVAGIAILFRKELCGITPAAWKTGLLLGGITSLIYTAEMYGIRMTEASKASFLTSTSIVMMPFLAMLFLHRKLYFRSILAAALTMAGVGVMSLTGQEHFSFAQGDGLLLLAALGYAMSSITVTKFGSTASSIQITFIQLFVTMVYMGGFTLIQGRGGSYPSQAIGAVVFLALGPTLVCFLLKNYALQRLGPLKCTLILSTEAVFCTILSVLILHDQLTIKVVCGIILIFLGILTETFVSTIIELIRKKTISREK